MSLNKAIIIGRLGKDPEVKQAGQSAVTNFSVATSESWTGKDGLKQERTEWHNVQVWGKLGDICAKYLKKGKLVYLEGKIQTDQFEKNGEKRFITKIIASVVQFLDPLVTTETPQVDSNSGHDDDFPI